MKWPSWIPKWPWESAPSPTVPEPTLEEIKARLTLVSPELAKEVLEIARSQVQSELGRQTRLDSKASSLITAAGLSLTVASSLAGILASRRDLELPGFLLALFAVMALLGLVAVGLAVAGLFVRDYSTLNAAAVFNQDALNMAEAPPGAEDLKSPVEKYAFGLAIYRQFMTAHLWEIYAKNRARLERKAVLIKVGQGSFLAFLLVLLTCEILLFGVLSEGRAGETASPEPAAAEASERVTAGRERHHHQEGPDARSASAPAAPAAPAAGEEEVERAMPDKPPPPNPPPPSDSQANDSPPMIRPGQPMIPSAPTPAIPGAPQRPDPPSPPPPKE